MGVGFAVDCRWSYPVQSHKKCDRRRHGHLQETARKYILKSCSSASLTVDRGLSQAEEADELRRNFSSVPRMVGISGNLRTGDEVSCSPVDDERLQFGYLLENLHRIEGILVHSNLETLERDILLQIGRLGALELFYSFLPWEVTKVDSLNASTLHHFKEIHIELLANVKKPDSIVYSRKKQQRKLRRKKALADVSGISVPSSLLNRDQKVEKTTTSDVPCPQCPDKLGGSFNTVTRPRHHVAMNESKLSMGVKDVANLERIHVGMEEKIGRPISFAKWAEAAGIDQKSLRRRLHFGWHCRDKLLRSTHSLVVYLAKVYKGMGISFDDLIQAGKVGVLLGAERFDSSRGYRFSTYVQYWIKKSMSSLVAQHSRGIHIPPRIEKIIKQIQKTRRSHADSEGSYLQENELAELTGISIANIRLANKWSRPMGSIDHKLRGGLNIKLAEIIPDVSIETPSEVVLKQHLRSDIHKLLAGLQPRERQVICLRYGIHDGRCRSLSEIGSLANVSKEWIRKIEKSALIKLRDEETQAALKHYIHLSQL